MFDGLIAKYGLAADQDAVVRTIQHDLNASNKRAESTQAHSAPKNSEEEAKPDVLATFTGHEQASTYKGEYEEGQCDADEPWRVRQDQLVRGVARDFHGGTLQHFPALLKQGAALAPLVKVRALDKQYLQQWMYVVFPIVDCRQRHSVAQRGKFSARRPGWTPHLFFRTRCL